MKFPRLRQRLLCFVSFLFLAAAAVGDAPVPGSVLNPQTPAEAWNIIRLSTANVEQLIQEKRWPEIPVQISFCSPALRRLAEASGSDAARAVASRTTGWVVALANASIVNNEAGCRAALATLQTNLRELATHFDPQVVAADIFLCPMHPDFVAERAATPCAKCGMALMPRRIPYSFIYMKPGKPSLQLTTSADGPIEAGRKVEVKVQLRKGDGTPAGNSDLIVMHTQRIHLLIEEPALGDYHHEHPVPTNTPGEYAFSFIPTKTAPYRIWADMVPMATGVQELPWVDLPSPALGGAIADKDERFNATCGALKFDLSFTDGQAPRAQRTCGMKITVTEADGQPAKRLEPLMNVYAHLVGFYDDFQTVVHLHPGGGEVTNQDLRGGPTLFFTFFPPKPGFIRLYCQVMINGENLFAPFNVTVAP